MQLITVWVRTGSLFALSVSGQEVVASLQQLHWSKAPFVKCMTGKRERVQTHDGRYCSWAVWRSCEQRRVLFLSGDAIRRVGFRGELNNEKRKIGLQKQHDAVGSSSCRPRRNARRGHASDCIQRIPWPWTAACFDSGRLSQLQWITAPGLLLVVGQPGGQLRRSESDTWIML